MYATKAYELTDVMFFVWIEIWTGFKAAAEPALLPAELAAIS